MDPAERSSSTERVNEGSGAASSAPLIARRQWLEASALAVAATAFGACAGRKATAQPATTASTAGLVRLDLNENPILG